MFCSSISKNLLVLYKVKKHGKDETVLIMDNHCSYRTQEIVSICRNKIELLCLPSCTSHFTGNTGSYTLQYSCVIASRCARLRQCSNTYFKQRGLDLGQDKVMVLFINDKVKVPLGSPGHPVSTGARGREIVMLQTLRQ